MAAQLLRRYRQIDVDTALTRYGGELVTVPGPDQAQGFLWQFLLPTIEDMVGASGSYDKKFIIVMVVQGGIFRVPLVEGGPPGAQTGVFVKMYSDRFPLWAIDSQFVHIGRPPGLK